MLNYQVSAFAIYFAENIFKARVKECIGADFWLNW